MTVKLASYSTTQSNTVNTAVSTTYLVQPITITIYHTLISRTTVIHSIASVRIIM